MIKKGSNFFEDHIEKVVFVLVGLICVWLLITHVFLTTNAVKYDNKVFGPGDIDDYVDGQAKRVDEKLNLQPQPAKPYNSRTGDFNSLIASAVTGDYAGIYMPQPSNSSGKTGVKKAYAVPGIGMPQEPAAEHIRAVAYVPSVEISEQNQYGLNNSQLSDIDFVTVEAKFDVAQMYKNFKESFAGDDIPEEWRDSSLVSPVLAAVELQRQQMLSDGNWGNWEVVPKTRVEPRRKTFEVIEDISKLPPGGLKVRMLQFRSPDMKVNLLQPKVYSIASPREEWFPPSLHRKFLKYQAEIEVQEKQKVMAAKIVEQTKATQEQQRTRMAGRVSRQTGTGGDEEEGSGDASYVAPKAAAASKTRSDRFSEKQKLDKIQEAAKPGLSGGTSKIMDEYTKIMITAATDLASMREPLVIWAHDDTVELNKSYRYRMRLGVFNPIAGTDQFYEKDQELKNKVVLWSRFSDVTESVSIPGMMYFFPNDAKETAKIVTVQVARYVLGYWYSKNFTVQPGEVIGKKSEPESRPEFAALPAGMLPAVVDYSTGAVLVDIVPVNDWSGGKTIRDRHYFDMLYSLDGKTINRVPVKQNYWAEELKIKYEDVKRLEKQPREPLRSFGSRMTERGVSGGDEEE